MRYVLILLLSMTAALVYSADGKSDPLNKLETGEFTVRQRPGTDAVLSEWLADAGVSEDTVYAFMYIPASCPRCETGLKRYSRYLRDRGEKFVIMTVLGDRKAAEQYNKKNNYQADYYTILR